MHFQKSFVAAALAGVAFAKSGDSIEDQIPKCAQPCIAEAQKSVTCQLSDLSCLCSNLPALESNSAVTSCFTTSCTDASVLTGLLNTLNTACKAGTSATGTGSATVTVSASYTGSASVSSGYSTVMTSASGIYSNSTATATKSGSGSGSGSGPAATSPTSGGSSPSTSTKPSSASRSEFGMASLAVALVVAMVSF